MGGTRWCNGSTASEATRCRDLTTAGGDPVSIARVKHAGAVYRKERFLLFI
ncbi:hypothetical protein BSIN_2025 [Burkholderia singularis]|uniref:Uncharacterized protein n=1 Tax=Burkholderia singularis TaxID=1503053 RepID=A0A238H0I4_9BURK|nr:hypothetical protein BSIN_2025 [Burkholderia singularis]